MGRSTMALGVLYRLFDRDLFKGLDRDRLPRHIGIVLDGHRRHAREERLPTYTDSYRVGMRRFEEFLGWAEELDPYFEVLVELFGRLPALCAKYDMGIRFIGSLDLLPAQLVSAAKSAQEAQPWGSRRLNIAMGYGGRQEIVDAAKDLVAKLVADGTPPDEIGQHIDADSLAEHMYSADLPDPDLLIRTSGESRLSGFLLWQSAYSEFVFVDVNWPAFRRVDFLRALRDFTSRDRRFGK